MPIKNPKLKFLVSFVSIFVFYFILCYTLFYDFIEVKSLVLGFPGITTRLIGGTLASSVSTRGYVFKPWDYGNAKWDPDNYSNLGQKVLTDFKDALDSNDKETAYNIMYAILGNENAVFTQGYGKIFSNVNSLLMVYNKKNPNNPIMEKEFLDMYKYQYSEAELNFLSKENQGTLLTNIQEILAPKVIMKDNTQMLIERAGEMADKVNLSGQSSPEYTIGIFQNDLIVYDSDLKVTNEDNLNLKFVDLQQKLSTNIFSKKQIFGFNIYVVAKSDSESSDIILTKEQVQVIKDFFLKNATEHPRMFKNFDIKSDNFLSFMATGNTKYLNKLNVPSPRFMVPQEFHKLVHDKTQFERSMVRKACNSDDRGSLIFEDDDI